MEDVFEGSPLLRVLHLADTSIEVLPDSVGKLLHLRYLNVDSTSIRQLPESIGRLANLQTLSARECGFLHQLPTSIAELRGLRCLRLDGTPLSHVPRGILNNLKTLNHLSGFVVGFGNDHDNPVGEQQVIRGCDLAELDSLTDLAFLTIHRLENSTSRDHHSEALSRMSKLRVLALEWTAYSIPYGDAHIQKAENILTGLSNSSFMRVQDLWIEGFPGRRFPDVRMTVAGHSPLSWQVAYLQLRNFRSCKELPPLSNLPNLKYLHIMELEAVKTIGPEEGTFAKLEHLDLVSMPRLEAWIWEKPTRQKNAFKPFPNLNTCRLLNCPKLKDLGEYISHAAQLRIEHAPHIKDQLSNLLHELQN